MAGGAHPSPRRHGDHCQTCADQAAVITTGTASLTALTRRRSSGNAALLAATAAAVLGGKTMRCSAEHAAADAPAAAAGCCNGSHGGSHHDHHHHDHDHDGGCSAAGQLQEHALHEHAPPARGLLRHSSGGPVMTRIHAAAICCPMEARLIHSILDRVPGVSSVDVNVVTKLVAVQHDPAAISPAALMAALNSAGLQASLNKHSTSGGADAHRGGSCAGHQHQGCSSGGGCCDAAAGSAGAQPWQQHWWRQRLPWLARLQGPSAPPLLVLLSGLLLLVNLLLLLPGLPTPELLRRGLLALVAAAIAVLPVMRKAWVGLKNKNLDMNCLVVVALFGAVGLGDFFEAGALVVLFTLAEWLEERCVSRAAGAMEDILRLQPDTALVIMEQQQQQQQQQEHQHEHNHAIQQQDAHHHEHDGCCAGAGAGAGTQQAAHHSHHAGGSGLAGSKAQHGTAPCCGHDHHHHHHSVQAACSEPAQAKQDTCDSGRAAHADSHHQHDHQHGCCDHQHDHSSHQQQQQQAAAAGQHAAAHHVHGDACCHGNGHGASSPPPPCSAQQQQQQQQQPGGGPVLLEMPVAQLPAGVLVLVRPGDKVPVDGTVEAGVSVVDESMVTGESRAVARAPGDGVLAGTVNCGSAALRVRATAAAGDSTVARLGALMEAAAASKSRHDMAVEAFARYYTPTIVAIAAATAGVGSALHPADWSHWCYLALVVLVTGCPCALVISTPVASVAGLTRAARKGVLVKGGRSLELLGKLSAATFDKSGTLTEGHFQLTKVHTFGGLGRQEVLRMAAALEQHSNHPIAHAVVGTAAAGGCMPATSGADAACDVREVAGKGLQGTLQGRSIAVGSWAYAQQLLAAAHSEQSAAAGGSTGGGSQARPLLDDDVLAARQLLSSADTAGSTVVCLVVDGRLGGLLLLSDCARPDALAALEQLQELGVRCLMLTGDTVGAAAHIAGQLGMPLENVCAELLPQEKLEMVGTIRHRMAVEQQRRQQQRAWWRWPAGWQRDAASSSVGYGVCSSCGEPAGECSCRAVLGPQSSSSGGGIIGGAAAGLERLKRAAAAAAGSTGGGGGAGDSAHTSSSSSTGGTGRAVIIAHVGDGVNDAPALAGADVGVAMGVAGAALAVDAADVALFSNSLTSLPFVVRLGRRAGRVIIANTVFACSIKVAVLAAAAGGAASLWLSLLADVGSSLLVTLHALTLLRFEAGADDAAGGLPAGPLGSRVSGIPLAGQHELAAKQQPGRHHGAAAAPAAAARGSWWQRVLALLPGSGYAPLAARTPGVSAGTSRLGSLTAAHGGAANGGAGGGAGGGRELQEIAILARAAAPPFLPSSAGAGLRAGGAVGGAGQAGGGAPSGSPAPVFVLDADEAA